MKFANPTDESIFNSVLAAYEEEFGSSNIIIVVPKSWSKYIDCRKYTPMAIKLWDSNHVGIRVVGLSASYTVEV